MARPLTIPQPYRQLAEAVGGSRALARSLHVHHGQLYRWAHGDQAPEGQHRVDLERLFTLHGLVSPYRFAPSIKEPAHED
jgi:hypothetical protein